MPKRTKPPLPTRTREHSRNLRQASTDAENALWYRLRSGRLNGCKFRHQHPVPPYVVDFHCAAKHLVIELDGSQHNVEVDATRTQYLQSQGLQVLRFWDNEVLEQMDAVLGVILNALAMR